MSNKPDGGPAFPRTSGTSLDREGMTLRDYFAAKAPAISDEVMVQLIGDFDLNHEVDRNSFAGVLASLAFAYADAMLKARTK